jgi:hypothetical protein
MCEKTYQKMSDKILLKPFYFVKPGVSVKPSLEDIKFFRPWSCEDIPLYIIFEKYETQILADYWDIYKPQDPRNPLIYEPVRTLCCFKSLKTMKDNSPYYIFLKMYVFDIINTNDYFYGVSGRTYRVENEYDGYFDGQELEDISNYYSSHNKAIVETFIEQLEDNLYL